MILAEDEVALGTDHSGIMVLPEAGARHAARATSCRSSKTCSSSRRPGTVPTSSPSTGSPVRSRRCTTSSWHRPPVPTRSPTPTSRSTSGSRTSRAARATSAACSETSSIGPSPIWLQARLVAAGMRPISNVVDVTNYVMLALGNPLHAFDLATLHGGRIVVRRAEQGETIRTLDGIDRELEPADLMIADAERSIALAGIMGGEETEIGESTTDVLLEAANFEPDGIFAQLRAAPAAHRELEPLGEGRRPVPGRARRPAGDAAPRRDRGRTLDRARRRSGRAARAARDPLPALARGRGDRAADAARGAVRVPRPARLRAARRRRRRADLARTRRDPRDRRGRGGRPLATGRGAVHAPGAPGDVRRADARASATPAACRGRARGPRPRRDVHAVACALDGSRPRAWRLTEPISVELAVAADAAAAEPGRRGTAQRRARRPRRRALRDRARLPRRAASCRTSAGTSPGSWRAAGVVRRASSRRCTRR